jgi:hypothetical protein
MLQHIALTSRLNPSRQKRLRWASNNTSATPQDIDA